MFAITRQNVVRAMGAVVGTFVVATGGVFGVAALIGSPVSIGMAAANVLFVSTLVDITGLALLSLSLRKV